MKRRVLSKTTPFHTQFIKKKSPKRCRFERHCGSSSSPGRSKQGRKKIFSSSVFHRHLVQKDADQPHLPKKTFHVLEGRQHSGRPDLSLRGREEKKGEGGREQKWKEKRRIEQKRGGKKERKRKKKNSREKQRRERKKKEKHHQPPQRQRPPTVNTTATVARSIVSHRR